MTKGEAERECIRRWRELPKPERATLEQATTFAHSLVAEMDFSTSRDQGQVIRTWLQRDLQVRGGL
jgi:hypothetical protein